MFLKSYDFYDSIYSNLKDYKKESEKIKNYILNQVPNATNILDLGCGTGEHHKYLSKDFCIDGIEINENFIKIAKEKNRNCNYYLADMMNFHLDKKYDVILCLFATISYLKSVEQLQLTIKNISQHLSQNGISILEPWVVPELVKDGFPHMLSYDKKDLKICRMATCKTKGHFSKLDFHFLYGDCNGIKYINEEHELRYFNFEEILSSFKIFNMQMKYDPVGITGRGLYISSLNARPIAMKEIKSIPIST